MPPIRLRQAEPEPFLQFGFMFISHVIDQSFGGLIGYLAIVVSCPGNSSTAHINLAKAYVKAANLIMSPFSGCSFKQYNVLIC